MFSVFGMFGMFSMFSLQVTGSNNMAGKIFIVGIFPVCFRFAKKYVKCMFSKGLLLFSRLVF